jgi:hypothetical protein
VLYALLEALSGQSLKSLGRMNKKCMLDIQRIVSAPLLLISLFLSSTYSLVLFLCLDLYDLFSVILGIAENNPFLSTRQTLISASSIYVILSRLFLLAKRMCSIATKN